MLTRSKAKATNQHIFVDDKWNDAYIQTKDEQIEMLHSRRVIKSWEDDADSEEEEELERVAAKAAMAAARRGADGSESHAEQVEGWGDEEEEEEDRWISEDDTEDEEEEDDDDNAAQGGEQTSKRKCCPQNRSSGSWLAGGGLVENVLWTAAAVTLVPVALYATMARCSRRLRRRQDSVKKSSSTSSSSWPLESHSLRGVLFKAYTNAATLAVLLLVAAYGGVCGRWVSIPTTTSLSTVWPALVAWRPLQYRLDTCAASFASKWSDVLLSASASHGLVYRLRLAPLDLIRQTALLVVCVYLVTQFHRRWLKSLVLLSTLSLLSVGVVSDLRKTQRSAIEIVALDPGFAFANESIFIAVDGQNLEQGATIAWVPFWGAAGLQQRNAAEISKLFAQPLRNGGVRVAFDTLNEFVPCYAAPSSSSTSDTTFKCFARLRLRVKDQKSVPGWSLHHNDL